MKTSEIKFAVTVDEHKIPEKIQWEAADSGVEGLHDAKAMMLTVWDGKTNTSLRIDLWTKEMLIDDMKQFFYENLMTMAETYQRATNDDNTAREMKLAAEKFGQQVGILKAQAV
jgi:gliding motility-associated protein GldC